MCLGRKSKRKEKSEMSQIVKLTDNCRCIYVLSDCTNQLPRQTLTYKMHKFAYTQI